jgi:SAM-dependent methyltransferase
LIMHQHGHEFYDNLHAQSNIPETNALYNPLFQKVLKNIQDRDSRFVLEVGCGNGFLAEIILRQSRVAYRGFDFSAVAVRNAANRTGRPELFSRGDALDGRSYACDYDTIVCTEVLEHLDTDLDVIRIWRAGTWCVCTVPNFDYESHVRYFRSTDEVAARYGDLLDIKDIIKVRRPLILNGEIRKYFRTLRWSRNDPSRFLGYIGVQTFDRLGGWFLFCGPKKQHNG